MRDRTADLLRAKQTLSQLSYAPKQDKIIQAPPDGVNRYAVVAWRKVMFV